MKNKTKKLHSVNVLQVFEGTPQVLHSFADNNAGNVKAEELFEKLIRQECDVQNDSTNYSQEAIESFLDDGRWENKEGCTVFLIHST